MKFANLLIVSTTVALAASSAAAADADSVMPYDWSGFYLGVQGGYLSTNMELVGTGNRDFNGGTIGAHAGYNWQYGSMVLGLEADINYAWNSISANFGAPITVGTDWQGALRGRLGYAMDRTLIYGAAGLALTRGYGTSLGTTMTEGFAGWTLGAGLEHAFADRWSGRIEYRYAGYYGGDFGLGIGNFRIREHAVRLGASYRF